MFSFACFYTNFVLTIFETASQAEISSRIFSKSVKPAKIFLFYAPTKKPTEGQTDQFTDQGLKFNQVWLETPINRFSDIFTKSTRPAKNFRCSDQEIDQGSNRPIYRPRA